MAERILVDPQELRETSTAFHNASTDVEQALGELRSAAFGLDIGCWTVGEDAQMAPKFLQAEVDGRGRVGTRDRMGNTLTRVAGAFERTDTTSVQQLMGMPGWMEMAPMAAAAVGFNATAMSDLIPAPASAIATSTAAGSGPMWGEILEILWAAYLMVAIGTGLIALAIAFFLVLVGVLGLLAVGSGWAFIIAGLVIGVMALALVLVAGLFLALLWPHLTRDQKIAAATLVTLFFLEVVGFIIALSVAATVKGIILAIIGFGALTIGILITVWATLLPWLEPGSDPPAIMP